jgi:hypothetical protein
VEVGYCRLQESVGVGSRKREENEKLGLEWTLLADEGNPQNGGYGQQDARNLKHQHHSSAPMTFQVVTGTGDIHSVVSLLVHVRWG